MSNYFDILKHMPLTTSSVINMHPDGVAPEQGLTAEKLQKVWREIQRSMPAPVCVDLYGHDLGDQAYELKRPAGKRQFIVVPRARLMATYCELKQAGVDVRLEPRIREQPDQPTGDE